MSGKYLLTVKEAAELLAIGECGAQECDGGALW